MIELSSPAQLITANVSTMGVNPLALDDVEPPLRVTFTYSTKWIPTKYVGLNNIIHMQLHSVLL